MSAIDRRGACGCFVHSTQTPHPRRTYDDPRLPVEVLDKAFEYTAYADPENAQAMLCSLMLTCSHFRTIAKRHLIRIMCLTNVEQINSFADYLEQMVESGNYGISLLPIQHLAVAGKYRIFPRPPHRRSDAEAKAKRVLPFIITTAAPFLLTLTVFGMDSDHRSVYTSDSVHFEQHCVFCVPNGTTFPKLYDLIALEQDVIHLILCDDNGKPDKRACQLRYPNLRRLYISGLGGGFLPSALPYLEDLRLELLDQECVDPPLQEDVGHVRSLIIDTPKYAPLITGLDDEYQEYSQSRDEYDSRISKYQTLIEEVGNRKRNGVIVPASGFTQYASRGRILSGWADAVVGGEGCWTTAWIPTIAFTGLYGTAFGS